MKVAIMRIRSEPRISCVCSIHFVTDPIVVAWIAVMHASVFERAPFATTPLVWPS